MCQQGLSGGKATLTISLQGLSLLFASSFSSYRASLVAQLVKNPPAMQETRVQSLGWEEPLERGKVTHCSILAWRIPWTV